MPPTAVRPHIQVVPPLLRKALYAMLVVAAAVSVPFIGKYGPVPTTILLDAWLILFILACIARGKTLTTFTIAALGLYLMSRLLGVIASQSPLQDAAQAYRWVLYLLVFAFAVGREWGAVRPLVRVMWALLLMALVKSALTLAVLGPGERPGLLLENNFEIALFSGLVAVLYPHIRRRGLVLIVLGAIVAMSGSRSGAIAYVILALYAMFRTHMSPLLRYFSALTIIALGIATYFLFEQRAETTTRVDRLNFLDVFFSETSNWSPLNWLFGTPPITPLSEGACSRLSYYALLFSSEGDGSCYSVILHAFLMRVTFDAGLIGLSIAVIVPIFLMRRVRVTYGLVLTLTAIAVSNSFSVSGLNNPYVALPILLSILVAAHPPAGSTINANRNLFKISRTGQAWTENREHNT